MFLRTLKQWSKEATQRTDGFARRLLQRSWKQLSAAENFGESVRRMVEENRFLVTLPPCLDAFRGLRELHLCQFSRCTELPDCVGDLPHLEELHLEEWSALCGLPSTLTNLRGLRVLKLTHSRIRSLPEGFGRLQSLEQLDLSGSSELSVLPDDFSGLKRLQTLLLTYCTKLQRLPDDMERLRDLLVLCLTGCPELQRLPDSLLELRGLRSLNLLFCAGLESLPAEFLVYFPHLQLSYGLERDRPPISLESSTGPTELACTDEQEALIRSTLAAKTRSMRLSRLEATLLDFACARAVLEAPSRVRLQGLKEEAEGLQGLRRTLSIKLASLDDQQEHPDAAHGLLKLTAVVIALEHTLLKARQQRAMLVALAARGIDHQLSKQAAQAASAIDMRRGERATP